MIRQCPQSRDEETSSERIASVSITKRKGKEKQVSAYLGAQQPQSRKGNGIVTPLTSVIASTVHLTVTEIFHTAGLSFLHAHEVGS